MKRFELIAICATIIIASIFISVGLSKRTNNDRVVTVRGFAEREVPADLAVWPIKFVIGANSLDEIQAQLRLKIHAIQKYLETFDIAGDALIQAPNILNNSVDRYIDKKNVIYNFTATQFIFIRSKSVEQVKQAQQNSLELVAQGIVIQNDYDSKLQFEFTGLNDIKPPMISQSIDNARQAALQFAHDSGSKVGAIKTASQGLFTITDAAPGLSDRKIVRVTTSVEYLLK